MMIPEAWENHAEMDPARRAFYEFHAALMEPWDGPACIAFTDGTLIGAVLDRNGLRPGRYWVTEDGLVVLASEVGVLDLDPADRGAQGPAAAGPDVPRRHRPRPHRRRRRDQGRARGRGAVRRVAARRPDPPRRPARARARRAHARQRDPPPADLRLHRGGAAHPAHADGARPAPSRSARWAPTRRSRCCRGRPRLLFDYFSQLFAQVTNPPLDAIREELVTSLGTAIGPEQNLLTATPAHCRQVVLAVPGHRQRRARQDPAHQPRRRPARASPPCGSAASTRSRAAGRRCSHALEEIFAEVSEAIEDGRAVHRAVRPRLRRRAGRRSRRCCSPRRAPPPDPREDPHPGRPGRRGRRRPRGAPRRAAHRLRRRRGQPVPRDGVGRGPRATSGAGPGRSRRRRCANLIKALGKGVLKVMSKMGISTVASYHGAQVFEAVGLDQELVDALLHRHVVQARRHRARRASPRRSRGGTRSPTRAAARRAGAPQPRRRRRVPVAPRGRAAPVQPGDGVPAAARHPGPPVRRLQAVHDRRRRAVRAADDPARAVPVQGRRRERAGTGADRRGRAGRGDRQAVLHRRDVLRLDLAGGARDAGDRDEPARRQVQHRRGRRGQRAAVRRPALGRQAGGQRPVRRHQRVPGQRRRPADQDGAGREAGRGRPAARPQGLPVDRADPALHAGRRPDLAAAAPRHLLDRGPRPAHPRPEERQRPGPGARQARRRGRRRHGRGRREQGARRRRAHLRPRRRHRRLAADLAQARRRAVGARPRRDPADPAAQRAARPDRRAGRRPAQDRPRRRRSPRCSAPRSSASRPRRWSSAAAS